MKKIILSIASIIIISGAYAQTETKSKMMGQSENKYYEDSENKNFPDGFMLQNGKLMMIKNGKISQLENDTTLSDGTVIMSEGYFMKKNESKMMFKEGEHMDMSGKMTSVDSATRSKGSDNQNLSNGYLYRNGTVMKVKNGNMAPLEKDVKLVNGTTISKDGYYTEQDGEKTKFKEGEHIDMSGKITKTGAVHIIDERK